MHCADNHKLAENCGKVYPQKKEAAPHKTASSLKYLQ